MAPWCSLSARKTSAVEGSSFCACVDVRVRCVNDEAMVMKKGRIGCLYTPCDQHDARGGLC